MLGLGGGSIYVPLFSFLGYDLKTVAVPAGILLVLITGIASSINYIRHKLVDYKMALAILSGSLLSTIAGHQLFYKNASMSSLWVLLVASIILVGMKSLFLPEHIGKIKCKKNHSELTLGFAGGLIVGFISVSTGIGGGSLMVPLMLHLSFDFKRAIGTSSFVIVFTSLTGFSAHFFTTFDRAYFLPILVYALIVFAGGLIGSHLTSLKIKAKHAQFLMGFLLTGLGFYLLLKKFLFMTP
jgi:uncharacterized membrane protein YfcA